jgi:hypothetical protein
MLDHVLGRRLFASDHREALNLYLGVGAKLGSGADRLDDELLQLQRGPRECRHFLACYLGDRAPGSRPPRSSDLYNWNLSSCGLLTHKAVRKGACQRRHQHSRAFRHRTRWAPSTIGARFVMVLEGSVGNREQTASDFQGRSDISEIARHRYITSRTQV